MSWAILLKFFEIVKQSLINGTLEFNCSLKNWMLNIEFNSNLLYWQINAIFMNFLWMSLWVGSWKWLPRETIIIMIQINARSAFRNIWALLFFGVSNKVSNKDMIVNFVNKLRPVRFCAFDLWFRIELNDWISCNVQRVTVNRLIFW